VLDLADPLRTYPFYLPYMTYLSTRTVSHLNIASLIKNNLVVVDFFSYSLFELLDLNEYIYGNLDTYF
jgi:hypothetical protein